MADEQRHVLERSALSVQTEVATETKVLIEATAVGINSCCRAAQVAEERKPRPAVRLSRCEDSATTLSYAYRRPKLFTDADWPLSGAPAGNQTKRIAGKGERHDLGGCLMSTSRIHGLTQTIAVSTGLSESCDAS
jgi:hypothetical protein